MRLLFNWDMKMRGTLLKYLRNIQDVHQKSIWKENNTHFKKIFQGIKK